MSADGTPLGDNTPIPSATPSPPLTPQFTQGRATDTQYDTGDLEAFRREWQAEVTRRREADQGAVAGPSTLPPPRRREPSEQEEHRQSSHRNDRGSDDDEEARPHSPSRTRHLLQLAEEQRKVEAAEGASSAPSGISLAPQQRVSHDAPANGNAGTQAQMKAAVKAYATAAENERRGNLDEALLYYRKAFRLDSSADRLYERAYALLKESDDRAYAQLSAKGPLSASAAQIKSSNKQRDALLASPEVVELIRKATDFDDVRVERIDLAKAEQKRQEAAAVADGKPKQTNGLQQSPRSPRQQKIVSKQSGHDEGAAGPDGIDDRLDRIIQRAAEEAVADGRDLFNVSFASLPSLVSSRTSQKQEQAEDEAEDSEQVQGISEKLEQVSIRERDGQKQEEDLPPPLIAMLPDELLIYICSIVVEPRGKQGAKIKPPRELAQPTPGAVNGTTKQAAKDSAKSQPTKSLTKGEDAASSQQSTTSAPSSRKGPVGIGMVLAGPDWQSLEILARVCWKWRLITQASSLWKLILRETYLEPQLPLQSFYNSKIHSSDNQLSIPRSLFIHQPRLRMTGCYLSACHYSRPGLSVDNAWVRVIHLVEFYRSIRFLPDGRVLTLLTTDNPKETVGKMWTNYPGKGFAVGRWRVELEEDEVEEEGHEAEKTQEGAAGIDDSGPPKQKRRGPLPPARVILDDLRGE